MMKWKAWESETESLEYQFTNGNSFLKLFLFGGCSFSKIIGSSPDDETGPQNNGPWVLFLQIQHDLGSLIKHPL